MSAPDLAPLLRACGIKSDREQARDAVIAAHRAVQRLVNARSRRAALKNAREASAALELVLRVLPATPDVAFAYSLPDLPLGLRIVANPSVPADEFWLATNESLHKFKIERGELEEIGRVYRADPPER